MFQKLLRIAVIVALLAIAGTAIMYFNALPDKPMRDRVVETTQPAAVKAVETTKPTEPVDLTGKWKSTNPKVNMVAEVVDSTIAVDFVEEGGSMVAYWRGSFRPGNLDLAITSMPAETEFFLSSSPSKDFTYKNGRLLFEMSVMSVTTIVELERA